jgi:hypothetical protein
MRTIEKLLLCRGKFILGTELEEMNDGQWSSPMQVANLRWPPSTPNINHDSAPHAH